MELAEQRSLPEDIVVDILCRSPRKSLARFKCVSKPWRNLISDRNRVRPKTTHVGLVCQSVFHGSGPCDPSRMVFLHVDHNGRGSADQESSDLGNSFIEQQHPHGILLSSCNGFLLFGSYHTKYVVYSPAAKRSWHIFPPKSYNIPCVGLALDGDHFKVVCITVDDHHRNIGSLIFSSQNQEWLEKSAPHSVTIPAQPLLWELLETSVLVGGCLHWICGGFLLIFHLQDGHCQFLDLPKICGCLRCFQKQCIWESEGSLNYCNIAFGNKIRIWTLQRENRSSEGNQYMFKWEDKHEGILASPFAVTDEEGFTLFSPVAFNDDFAIVYLEHGSKIFSYNIATKEVKEACDSPFEGSDYNTQFTILPFLYLTQFDMATMPTKVLGDGDLCDPCPDAMLKKRILL